MPSACRKEGPDERLGGTVLKSKNWLLGVSPRAKWLLQIFCGIPRSFRLDVQSNSFYFKRKWMKFKESQEVNISYMIPHFYPLWGAYCRMNDPRPVIFTWPHLHALGMPEGRPRWASGRNTFEVQELTFGSVSKTKMTFTNILGYSQVISVWCSIKLLLFQGKNDEMRGKSRIQYFIYDPSLLSPLGGLLQNERP